MDKKIIWLASYPKSGNTWFRIILSNLLMPDKKEPDLDDMIGAPIASSRNVVELQTGFSTKNFTLEEADKFRPIAGDEYAKTFENVTFRKCHDAFTLLEDGRPLLGNPTYYNAIYIIRNPLSIVASLANHYKISLDKAIDQMEKENFSLNSIDNSWIHQFRQKLFSWSTHVNSWMSATGFETKFVRYEDLLESPFQVIRSCLDFAGIEYQASDLEEAIKKSDFKKIQKLEQETSFKEKPQNVESFFRKGRADSWKEELSKEQAARVIHYHWKTMNKFGYLNNECLTFAALKKSDLKE